MKEIKALRVKIDSIIQSINKLRICEKPDWMKRVIIAENKLIEAKMWLGKCLEAEGHKLPEEFRDEAKE